MSYWNDRHWVIINTEDVTDEIHIATEKLSAKVNPDKTKIWVKWDGEIPTCFEGMTIYNHSEILELLKGEDW